MKAAFFTLGCKVNQYETQNMLETLINAGYTIVPHDEQADVYIINSCTVTAVSDQKTRQTVRHYKRLYPNSIVVLTGCMPQAYPDVAMQLEEADIVIGNKNNNQLLEKIEEFNLTGRRVFGVFQHKSGETFTQAKISKFDERTRAFVKIQDGCNRFCSYCIIPTARGRVRSKSIADIKSEIENLANSGFKEIVLVGINLSSYGRDSGESFVEAVKTVCDNDLIERVRLGSLEPDHITPEIIEQLAKFDKLCPQFHLSLQSGCDKTLKRMNRHYTASEYEEICTNLRNAFENASITTDIMVGFPGESEEEFQDSLEFAKKINFAKVHIFPYSQRIGTKAAVMPDQIMKKEKKDRLHRMQEVTDLTMKTFLSSQVGSTFTVILETKIDENTYEGYTPNYTLVRVNSDEDMQNKIVNIKLTSAHDEYCYGEII